MLELFIRYFHLVFFALMGAVLFTESILVTKKMSGQDIHRLSILDAIYGISALIIFILGLVLSLYIGKPASFYNMNIFFQIKIGLFIILGLISIYPTLFFIRNRKDIDEIVEVPKLVKIVIIIELVLFISIPLFAVIMASGYGI